MPKIAAALLFAGATLLSFPALSAETRPPVGGGVSGSVQTAAGVTDSEQFVNMAAVSNIFEIRSSELALEKAQDENLRAFAQQMITDHQAALERMTAVLAQTEVQTQMPTEVDIIHAEKLDTLSGATNFDEQYTRIQIEAHDTAIALLESYGNGGDDPALKQFALEMLPTVKHHREMLPAEYPTQ